MSQRAILGSFVLLAGASLAMAHRNGIQWGPFWRRVGILAGAAVLVSIGTYIAFQQYFAFFGVLHALALFSILALPFIRGPLWLLALVAAIVIGLPLAWTNPAFETPWLAWIGLWPAMPMTVDLVPVFPWFGVLLVGLGGMRLILGSGWRDRLAAIRGGAILGALAWLGRWSLLIYLLHQPLIYGAVYGVTMLVRPEPAAVEMTQAEDFANSCRGAVRRGRCPRRLLRALLRCALDQIESGDLWDEIAEVQPTIGQESVVQGVIRICRAMAETPPTTP
ncbi:MAG: heparan-alpha-glucosaminide N-acetyltransferase [Hyphomicrobium sp.]